MIKWYWFLLQSFSSFASCPVKWLSKLSLYTLAYKFIQFTLFWSNSKWKGLSSLWFLVACKSQRLNYQHKISIYINCSMVRFLRNYGGKLAEGSMFTRLWNDAFDLRCHWGRFQWSRGNNKKLPSQNDGKGIKRSCLNIEAVRHSHSSIDSFPGWI